MMNSLDLAAALFDKDGTLLDFEKTWAPMAEHLLRVLGGRTLDRRRALSTSIGFSDGKFASDSIMIAGTSSDVLAAIHSALPDHPQEEIMRHFEGAIAKVEPVAITDLHPIFAQLKKLGVACAIVTNDDEALTRQQLQALGIEHFFQAIIGADSGAGRKPDAGPCLAAAQALGTPAETCVMIGDSLADMRAAKDAGMQACALLSGYLEANDFVDEADFVLPDIGAFPAWLMSAAAQRI